ncbi:unnamed protein product [Effrenium voratum]|nr:unnamed protein product [Effrenium voratum]
MAQATLGSETWLIQKSYTRVRSMSQLPETDDVRILTQQMRAYLNWYKANGTEPFFHRKSGRVVLSLLHVEHRGKAEFVRGINSEVSLPTGSICAERAAIVNARTTFPNINRKQMKGIAVLEVPLLNTWTSEVVHDLLNPLPPCGACNEWLLKIQEQSPSFYVVTYQDLSLEVAQERFLFWSLQESARADPDLGAWNCHCCHHQNAPLSTVCGSCGVDRFSSSYLRMPTQKKYFRVLHALEHCPMSFKELSGKLAEKVPDLKEVLQRLQRNRGKHKDVHPILSRDADGLYHLTETGRQILMRKQDALPSGRRRNARHKPMRRSDKGACNGSEQMRAEQICPAPNSCAMASQEVKGP